MPVLRQQSVDAHSFHVAHAALWLLQWHPQGGSGKYRLEVLEYSLTHDEDEAVYGDHPSPGKPPRDYAAMTQVQLLVKCADLLETLAFLLEETKMGNQTMGRVGNYKRTEFMEAFKLLEWEGRKPLASDLIKSYLTCVNPDIHPMLNVGEA